MDQICVPPDNLDFPSSCKFQIVYIYYPSGPKASNKISTIILTAIVYIQQFTVCKKQFSEGNIFLNTSTWKSVSDGCFLCEFLNYLLFLLKVPYKRLLDVPLIEHFWNIQTNSYK